MTDSKEKTNSTMYPMLIAVSLTHLINDSLQAVIPASYPILRESIHLSFTQLGIMTFILYFSSSVMQPFVGMYTDKRPRPYVLPLGMLGALLGMLGLALAPGYMWVLGAVIMVGVASAMFHPEGARIAYMAAGSRRGLAQSIFQVGGNAGGAMAPLITAFIFVPFGQTGAIGFTALAAAGIAIQVWIARWYRQHVSFTKRRRPNNAAAQFDPAHRKRVSTAVIIIILIAFARSWYGAGISDFFVYYLMDKFQLAIPAAQIYIFLYMGAGIAGTFLGGPLSDRIGRKKVILFSLLGSFPFAVLLPYANEIWAYVLLSLLGFINHSSFSVTVVYVQELVPGNVGMVSGLVTGLAFGMGAIGAVAIGGLIDLTSIALIITASSFLPLLGFLGFLLPSDRNIREWTVKSEAGM